jgi:hypothetical protein
MCQCESIKRVLLLAAALAMAGALSFFFTTVAMEVEYLFFFVEQTDSSDGLYSAGGVTFTEMQGSITTEVTSRDLLFGGTFVSESLGQPQVNMPNQPSLLAAWACAIVGALLCLSVSGLLLEERPRYGWLCAMATLAVMCLGATDYLYFEPLDFREAVANFADSGGIPACAGDKRDSCRAFDTRYLYLGLHWDIAAFWLSTLLAFSCATTLYRAWRLVRNGDARASEIEL